MLELYPGLGTVTRHRPGRLFTVQPCRLLGRSAAVPRPAPRRSPSSMQSLVLSGRARRGPMGAQTRR